MESRASFTRSMHSAAPCSSQPLAVLSGRAPSRRAGDPGERRLLHGTTEQGGYGGEIFRMDAAGNFTVLHRFDAYFSDGGRPKSGLIEEWTASCTGRLRRAASRSPGAVTGLSTGWTRPASVTVDACLSSPDSYGVGRPRPGHLRRAVWLHGCRRSIRAGRVVPGRSGALGCFADVGDAEPGAQVTGGSSSTGTVTLTGPAPRRGRSCLPQQQ